MLKKNWFNLLQVAVSSLTLAGGSVLYLFDRPQAASWAWMTGAGLVLASVLADTVVALWRRKFGLDLIALIAIVAALGMQETFAAAVIALMFASGRALESYAESRAQNEMSALLARAPRSANRYENGTVVKVALADIRPGDRLAVRAGETIPVDGTLLAPATLDESSLTGESLPVRYAEGASVNSGVVNAGDAFDLQATGTAEDSTFSHVIRLVRSAQASRAPAARLADRYALLFIPLTLGIAALAWALSGEPLRALAVLVVATPCPLILAVPVAIVSAMSRCAQRGVLIKHGGALEKMAEVRTVFLDKTGTLTSGKARLVAAAIAPSEQEAPLLALAASLEQMSGHAMAQALVAAARERGLTLRTPDEVSEEAGAGLSGRVDGQQVRVGSLAYVAGTAQCPAWARHMLEDAGYDGAALVCVAVDGQLCGVFQMADQIRLDAPRALRLLRAYGINHIAMLTGDRRDIAQTIASSLGTDAVLADQTPASKLDAIAAACRQGVTMMVGDGINDAPALAAADIGVAMGARGAAAAAESAQVVLLVDRLDRLVFAVRIAQQTRAIALQSVVAGMSLSFLAMVVAALGYLPPVAGAILQEVIDVAVIVNALRVLRLDVAKPGRTMRPEQVEQLRQEHARLQPVLEGIARLADRTDAMPAAALRQELAQLNSAIRNELIPHEMDDDATVYPRLARLIGGEDPLASMSSTHREIFRLGRVIDKYANTAAHHADDRASRADLRRSLYALDAILRLHFAQEEELYHGLSA